MRFGLADDRFSQLLLTTYKRYEADSCGYMAPMRQHSVRHLWKGAILGGSGWAVLRIASVWYFAVVASRWSIVHGTFAAALLVLVALYSGSCLFLYGAEFNAVLNEENSSSPARRF